MQKDSGLVVGDIVEVCELTKDARHYNMKLGDRYIITEFYYASNEFFHINRAACSNWWFSLYDCTNKDGSLEQRVFKLVPRTVPIEITIQYSEL